MQSLSQSQQQAAPSSARQSSSNRYATSQYPLEYGVVHTRYGTVAAGSVLAGISFGLQDRYLRVEGLLENNKDYSGLPTEMLNANVINYYAGTVAGTRLVLTFLALKAYIIIQHDHVHIGATTSYYIYDSDITVVIAYTNSGVFECTIYFVNG